MEPVLVVVVLGALLLFRLLPSEERRRTNGSVARARRQLDEDRPEKALELLADDDENDGSERRAVERSTVQLMALCRLRRFDEAERLLDRHPRPFLDEAESALWADARAQVRLGRGDAEGALAVLESAEPIPRIARAHLELTRLRVLAARGRDDEQVWRRLQAQPRSVLEILTRRHTSERAATIALRLLDGNAYR